MGIMRSRKEMVAHYRQGRANEMNEWDDGGWYGTSLWCRELALDLFGPDDLTNGDEVVQR